MLTSQSGEWDAPLVPMMVAGEEIPDTTLAEGAPEVEPPSDVPYVGRLRAWLTRERDRFAAEFDRSDPEYARAAVHGVGSMMTPKERSAYHVARTFPWYMPLACADVIESGEDMPKDVWNALVYVSARHTMLMCAARPNMRGVATHIRDSPEFYEQGASYYDVPNLRTFARIVYGGPFKDGTLFGADDLEGRLTLDAVGAAVGALVASAGLKQAKSHVEQILRCVKAAVWPTSEPTDATGRFGVPACTKALISIISGSPPHPDDDALVRTSQIMGAESEVTVVMEGPWQGSGGDPPACAVFSMLLYAAGAVAEKPEDDRDAWFSLLETLCREGGDALGREHAAGGPLFNTAMALSGAAFVALVMCGYKDMPSLYSTPSPFRDDARARAMLFVALHLGDAYRTCSQLGFVMGKKTQSTNGSFWGEIMRGWSVDIAANLGPVFETLVGSAMLSLGELNTVPELAPDVRPSMEGTALPSKEKVQRMDALHDAVFLEVGSDHFHQVAVRVAEHVTKPDFYNGLKYPAHLEDMLAVASVAVEEVPTDVVMVVAGEEGGVLTTPPPAPSPAESSMVALLDHFYAMSLGESGLPEPAVNATVVAFTYKVVLFEDGGIGGYDLLDGAGYTPVQSVQVIGSHAEPFDETPTKYEVWTVIRVADVGDAVEVAAKALWDGAVKTVALTVPLQFYVTVVPRSEWSPEAAPAKAEAMKARFRSTLVGAAEGRPYGEEYHAEYTAYPVSRHPVLSILSLHTAPHKQPDDTRDAMRSNTRGQNESVSVLALSLLFNSLVDVSLFSEGTLQPKTPSRGEASRPAWKLHVYLDSDPPTAPEFDSMVEGQLFQSVWDNPAPMPSMKLRRLATVGRR